MPVRAWAAIDTAALPPVPTVTATSPASAPVVTTAATLAGSATPAATTAATPVTTPTPAVLADHSPIPLARGMGMSVAASAPAPAIATSKDSPTNAFLTQAAERQRQLLGSAAATTPSGGRVLSLRGVPLPLPPGARTDVAPIDDGASRGRALSRCSSRQRSRRHLSEDDGRPRQVHGDPEAGHGRAGDPARPSVSP